MKALLDIQSEHRKSPGQPTNRDLIIMESEMAFPIKVCVICNEEFELKPNKPGFANRCPQCSEPEEIGPTGTPMDTVDRKTAREANEARRQAMRNLLYRKDS